MLRWLAHALFPLTCVGCGKEKTIACDSCISGVRFFEGTCSVTGLDHVAALYSYSDPVVKGVLRAAKFHGVDSAEHAIVRLTDKGVARCGALLPKGRDVIIVPMPTTQRRLRERGFDQIRWMAADISAYVAAPVVEALAVHSHARQSRIAHYEARTKNISGAFSVRADVKGKQVILVDDVVTSGATMMEAARVLRTAGAVSIFGIALARGGKANKKPQV